MIALDVQDELWTEALTSWALGIYEKAEVLG